MDYLLGDTNLFIWDFVRFFWGFHDRFLTASYKNAGKRNFQIFLLKVLQFTPLHLLTRASLHPKGKRLR